MANISRLNYFVVRTLFGHYPTARIITYTSKQRCKCNCSFLFFGRGFHCKAFSNTLTTPGRGRLWSDTAATRLKGEVMEAKPQAEAVHRYPEEMFPLNQVRLLALTCVSSCPIPPRRAAGIHNVVERHVFCKDITHIVVYLPLVILVVGEHAQPHN